MFPSELQLQLRGSTGKWCLGVGGGGGFTSLRSRGTAGRTTVNGFVEGRHVYTNAHRLIHTSVQSSVSLIPKQTGQTGFTAPQSYGRFQ